MTGYLETKFCIKISQFKGTFLKKYTRVLLAKNEIHVADF